VSGRHTTRRALPWWVRALVVAAVGFGAVGAGAAAGYLYPEEGPLDPARPPAGSRPVLACVDSSATWGGRTWWSCAPSSSPSSPPSSSTSRVEVTTTKRR
jgi:hypothetical protein